VPVPDDIDDRTAASLMMQGLTASHFATDFWPRHGFPVNEWIAMASFGRFRSVRLPQFATN
jgi:NADPH:quinone reductase-like Zn-dependent oxidoreductase